MHGPSQTSDRIAQLDGLRGIAVSLVVLFHYGAGFPAGSMLDAIASRGWIGVDLFFVMSGFLIGGIVIANKNTGNLLLVFYTRRFLRIFPLYYALLAAVGILALLHPMPDLRNLAFYALYTQNNLFGLTGDPGSPWLQPTWSLAIEEQFYLILPAIVLLTSPKSLKVTLVAGIVAAFFLRVLGYLIPVKDPQAFALFLTPCRCDGLFYGVLLAILIRDGVAPRLIKLLYVGFGLCIVGFVATSGGNSVLFAVALSLLGPAFFCAVALSIVHRDGPIAWVTQIRMLRWLGIRTYAIYLFHMPALMVARGVFKAAANHSSGLSVFPALALTLFGAAASWRFVEAPLIRFGHRTKYENAAKPIVSAPDERSAL